MARIRSIKPEFWTDARVGDCSPTARLLFIGTWNVADDHGNLDRLARQIKAQIFPYDTIDCEPLLQELIAAGLLSEYEANGKTYLHINGFDKHQKIEKKSLPRHPLPEDSPTTPRLLPDQSALEGKGREGKGVEGNGENLCAESTNADPAQLPPCPIEKIINLYHEKLPTCTRVRVRNDSRNGHIRARWRQILSDHADGADDAMAILEKFFDRVAASNFLTGRAPAQPGRPPFVADLDWLMRPQNFAKVIEGKYA